MREVATRPHDAMSDLELADDDALSTVGGGRWRW
jgi:hypothetical protein